jgi:hypothetical protein
MENGAMNLPRLKDYRAEKIDMDCRRCERYAVLDRKVLVRKFGASCQFVDLKRKLAVGCDRRGDDQCEARFPCLLRIGVLIDQG